MSRIGRLTLALLATFALMTSADATSPPLTSSVFKVTQAKLAVNQYGGKNCPAKLALIARFVTTEPGSVTFRYRKAGGGKSKLITIKTSKGATGLNVAKHVQAMTLAQPTSTKYMVEVKGFPVISQWVDVKSDCAKGGVAADALTAAD